MMRTYWTVRDIGNCGHLLAIRDTMAEAHTAAADIELEFDRECGVSSEEFDESNMPGEYEPAPTS